MLVSAPGFNIPQPSRPAGCGMIPTPEDLLKILQATLGEEAGQAAWIALDEVLSGHRLYWPQRIRRELLARVVYERRSHGHHPLTIARSLKVTVRTVQRIYRWEMEQRRLRHALAKDGNAAA